MIFWLSIALFVLAILTVTLGPTLALTLFWRIADWRRSRR